MHAIDKKIMICCDRAILPKTDLAQKPEVSVYWKCLECGKMFEPKMQIKGILTILKLVNLIDAYKAHDVSESTNSQSEVDPND